jgi:hypothetical protein
MMVVGVMPALLLAGGVNVIPTAVFAMTTFGAILTGMS